MKKILVSQRLDELPVSNERRVFECRESLDMRWAELLYSISLLPVPAASGVAPHQYFEELSISGLLLTGGNTLSDFSHNPVDQRRDIFERELVRHARARGIPIFGVCRGMQILVHELGGALCAVEDHVGRDHQVNFKTDNQFGRHLGRALTVNSFHGYAVESLPREFQICGVAEDGTVEAVEHAREPIAAVMWHPERRTEHLVAERNLLAQFFAGVDR